MSKSENTVVGDLEEGELLARILPRLRRGSEVLVGPGDDAAVVALTKNRIVASQDTLVQDRDFRLVWPSGYRSSGHDVGWKAVAQNLSDMNAMGSTAIAMLVSLTLPERTPLAWVDELVRGFQDALDVLAHGACSIVGGDLSSGGAIVVTVSVWGTTTGSPLLRSTAQPGHILTVTGPLGVAAAGWRLLEGKKPYGEFGEDYQRLVHAFLSPRPVLALGSLAARSGASALMDLSDGLLRDAGRLAAASRVRLDFDPEGLAAMVPPLQAAAREVGHDPMDWVLNGGEDYGLLATFSRQPPRGFHPIGTVKPGNAGVSIGNQQVESAGWDHFAR